MFWKYNFGSSAQIETLLQKEDVTLSELMDEDELLQECKAQNRKLIDFLTRAEILDELVCLVVNEPAMDGELQMRFKYANLAAELLTADVPAIIDKLVASTNLLDILYKFLKKEKPLNPLLASFFSKVLGMLVQRRSEQNWYSYQFTCFQVLDFLKSKGDFVELAVQHVGTSAIMDLILRLICNVEEDEIRQSVHQWLNETQLIERLVERLSPEADPEEHSSADNILCEISTSCRDVTNDSHPQSNPLLLTLESEETINKLLDLLLHEERNESSLSHVINILLTLLAARTQQQIQQQQQGSQQSTSIESSNSVSSEGKRNAVARTIAKRLPSLHNILLHPPKKGLILTAYGQEVEPLGSTRLQVVTLVAALVAANDPIVHNALYELNTVEYLLDLFFKFMLNNFLHTQVEQCLTAILTKAPVASSPQGETDHLLLTQLFTECRIIERVVKAYEEPSEPHDSKQIHNIKGYMGHLRQLANTIVQQAEFGPNEHRIKRLIQDLPGDKATQWDDFVSNALAEVNRKNEITPLPRNYMLSGSSSGSEHDWGLTSVEGDETEGGPHMYQERQEESEEENKEAEHVLGQETETYQLMARNKGFKEMDMDVIGDFRYADDEFKDPDDNLSGPLQRLSTQALALSGTTEMGMGTLTGGQGIEGGGEGGVVEDRDLFEEMCAHRRPDMNDFDDMWSDKEKEITFNQESVQSENDKEKDAGSSSEEEDEEEYSGVRSGETKMEVDPDDWAEVFDKRSSGGQNSCPDEPINPWQSAPMADTSDNTGWADFGGNVFGGASTMGPFGPSHNPKKDTFSTDFTNVFGPPMAQQDSSNTIFGETTPNQEAFKADFSSVNFDSAFETNCDDQKNTVTPAGEPQKSFLSSRGLLKNNDKSSGSSDAGTTAPVLSKSEVLPDDHSQQDGLPVAVADTPSQS
ncbi:serine/threonine-protein phosphatase 6 regulatory subunit 3 isoform X6 [Cherax quadricarinatus]|uniref:serine/threonine-protein phosphatase 6 regulatory subunit 3 isoform X6 n=1 Tax=Cherax quadricarinatus TaxID=27406 RepID=UPI00387EACFA